MRCARPRPPLRRRPVEHRTTPGDVAATTDGPWRAHQNPSAVPGGFTPSNSRNPGLTAAFGTVLTCRAGCARGRAEAMAHETSAQGSNPQAPTSREDGWSRWHMRRCCCLAGVKTNLPGTVENRVPTLSLSAMPMNTALPRVDARRAAVGAVPAGGTHRGIRLSDHPVESLGVGALGPHRP